LGPIGKEKKKSSVLSQSLIGTRKKKANVIKEVKKNLGEERVRSGAESTFFVPPLGEGTVDQGVRKEKNVIAAKRRFWPCLPFGGGDSDRNLWCRKKVTTIGAKEKKKK